MTYEDEFKTILEFQGMYKNNFSALYLTEGQIDTLIEYVHELRAQAERVQELESLYRIEKECSLDLLVRNKRYREAIEKAIEEEEQNLEGYQSIVHRILADALEGFKKC